MKTSKEEIISKMFSEKGPCLVPRDKDLPVCHENDYCRCDVEDVYKEALKNDPVVLGLVEALRKYHEAFTVEYYGAIGCVADFEDEWAKSKKALEKYDEEVEK